MKMKVGRSIPGALAVPAGIVLLAAAGAARADYVGGGGEFTQGGTATTVYPQAWETRSAS